MKSFFQQYQKHSLKKQLQILVPAFVLALGLNFVLFTEGGHRLSSSIVDYGEVASSDVSVLVDPEEGVGSVRVHRSIPKDVESIHFTLLYDDEAVLLSDFSSANGQLIKITDTVPLSVSVSFSDPRTLGVNDDIVHFSFASLALEPRTINISDVFFTSGNQRFELTSQGSGPF